MLGVTNAKREENRRPIIFLLEKNLVKETRTARKSIFISLCKKNYLIQTKRVILAIL